ncbi:MAG: PQQ-dependent sugar dehydrogenase, partial [Gammaproteobacteria bacterium]
MTLDLAADLRILWWLLAGTLMIPHGLRMALMAVAALSLGVVCPSQAASLAEPSALATGTRALAPDFSRVEVGLVTAMRGFVDPILLTHAGDGSRRLFIVEQRGVVKISKRGQVLPIPFLDLQSRVLSGGERGLLGLAFHPEHESNRKFYVFFTEQDSGDLIIAELRASARNRDRAVLRSFRRLLRVR